MDSHVVSKKRSFLWIIPFLAAILGTGIGAVSAVLGYQPPSIQLAGHEAQDISQLEAPIDKLSSRAIVPDGNEYDFGMMARGEKKSHAFLVRNIGNGPLTLNVVNTTCKCTVGELEKDTIPAGESVEVTLTWEARSYDREFRQSATIETNDRATRELVFSVYGEVSQLALPEVPMATFTRVSRSEPKTFRTPIYGYRDSDLLITSHDFSDPSLAEFFDVTVEPLPEAAWSDPAAKSGLMCTVVIKPGLPIGEVEQGIKLNTNKKDIPPLELGVTMTVVSDISVVGSKFYSDKNLLVWGAPAKGDVENRRKLFLIVKGQYKQDVEFAVIQSDPEQALTAEFGDAVEVKREIDGKSQVIARRFPMDVVIKKGASGIQRMGNDQGPLGQLVLSTNHPEIDEYKIFVKFSVE